MDAATYLSHFLSGRFLYMVLKDVRVHVTFILVIHVHNLLESS